MFKNLKHIQKMINDDEERSIHFYEERSIVQREMSVIIFTLNKTNIWKLECIYFHENRVR